MTTLPTPSPTLSFEFFPPKTDPLEQSLWHAVHLLKSLKPAFVSVTYGAGGTTRTRTHDIVTHLQSEHGLPAAAHLTCVGATREEIDAIARDYWNAGIRHIVALRGDAPAENGGKYVPTPGGYAYASDLVEGLLKVAPFEISVAAYPETHPEAVSADADFDNLKRKIDAGSTRAIAQFFFDNEVFYRFRDRADKAGVTVPIVPGVLPVANFARALVFAGRCGAVVPPSVHQRFAGFDEMSPEAQLALASDFAAAQCLDLLKNGAEHFHFYTLNRAELVMNVCGQLGVGVPLFAES